jgi:hypothetical protein
MTRTQERGAFRGWVLMNLRGQDFIASTLRGSTRNLVDVTLHSQGPDGRQATVATLRAPVAGGRDLSRLLDLPLADRYWQLHIQGSGRRPGAGRTARTQSDGRTDGGRRRSSPAGGAFRGDSGHLQ